MFLTKSGTTLHAGLRWPFVAFQVDGIEPDAQWPSNNRERWYPDRPRPGDREANLG